MSYPPQPVLATPCHLPAVSSAVVSLSDDRMALLSEEEEMSSEHLKFKAPPPLPK